MGGHEKHIEAAYLVRCSPQRAYDWLRDHGHKGTEKPSHYGENSAVLEYLLVRRNDPLIDLGIAQFGTSTAAIKRVFKRGDTGIRCAALSNPRVGPSGFLRHWWLDEDGIVALIESGSDAELEALAKNEFLSDDAIEHLLERSKEFSKLSDNQYLKMLMWLGGNPRMSKPYDHSKLDGYAEYSHGRVFHQAWELARTLPTEEKYADVLYELLNNTTLPVLFDDAKGVIDRWHIESPSEHDERPNAASYWLRSRLADVMEPNDDLLNSDDWALRESFYRRFRPRDYEDWPKFMEKDHAAFDALIENPELWQTQERREQLSEGAWEIPDPHSSMMAPNQFRWEEERKRRDNPEWFKDEDEEYSTKPDAVIRALAKIDRIERTLDKLDGDGDDSLRNVSSGLRDVKEWLREFPVQLSTHGDDRPTQPAPKVVPTWVWVVGIVIAILFLLKPQWS
jgi:hypothetical protein